MRTKDRLLAASSAEELREAMRHMLLRGSGDWTLEHVRKFVRPELWPELDAYFDVDGDPLPISEWPAHVEPALPAVRPSLSELIANFHRELAAAAARPSVFRAAPHTEPGARAAAAEEPQAASIEAAPAPPEPALAAVGRFFCPICEDHFDDEPVAYRSVSMCPPCALKVRVD